MEKVTKKAKTAKVAKFTKATKPAKATKTSKPVKAVKATKTSKPAKPAKVTKTTKKELSAKDRKKVTGGKTNRKVIAKGPLRAIMDLSAKSVYEPQYRQYGMMKTKKLEQQLFADGYKPEEVKEILEQIQNEG